MIGIPPFVERLVMRNMRRQMVADSIAHLNYCVTTCLLFFFAVAIAGKQYIGSPIRCWVPGEFKREWEIYTQGYCFIRNMYYVPFESTVFPFGKERVDDIRYYELVYIFLIIQSICFFLPNVFWISVQKKMTIDPRPFLTEAKKISRMTGSKKEEELTKLANFFLDNISLFGYRCNFCDFSRSGKNALLLYLLTKAFYVFNVYCQGVVLYFFLGERYLHWGYEAAWNLVQGNVWEESAIFPRVTMCDFKVWKLGNVHKNTVQCLLMLNVLNEKIYFFLYFWFIILAILNT